MSPKMILTFNLSEPHVQLHDQCDNLIDRCRKLLQAAVPESPDAIVQLGLYLPPEKAAVLQHRAPNN